MITGIACIPLAIPLLWLCAIRPYCIRNGSGYTPGANIGVTLWIDWQQANEIAKSKGDRGMILVCKIVFWLHVVIACIFLLSLIAIITI